MSVLAALVITSCLDAGMTKGCEPKTYPVQRQTLCEWDRVARINHEYKMGRFAVGECLVKNEGVAKR